MVSQLHCFWAMRRRASWSRGCGRAKLLTSWWPGDRERAEARIRHSPKGYAPSGLLLPARPHLLKFLESPKIVPPAGGQALSFSGTVEI
jgi:hypothetical protein